MTEILVTAGPTREHLDDVRFLSNGSTGRMGYAIAHRAAERGCTVTLVSGPTGLPPPPGVHRVEVVSANEMLDAARAAFASCDAAIFVAAVADHRPRTRIRGKPPKGSTGATLELVPNPDIAALLGAEKGKRVCAGFALESIDDGGESAALARARQKLRRKHFDLCVLNAPAALARDTSQVRVIDAAGEVFDPPNQDKAATAALIVDRVLALVAQRRSEPGAGTA